MVDDRETAFLQVYKSSISFWSNYTKACSWLKVQGFEPVNCPFKCPIVSNDCLRKVEKKEKTRQHISTVNQEEESITELESTSDADSTDSDGVDDDYVRFILETRKHQKELEKLKAERIKMEENEEIIYKDICEIDQQRLIGSSFSSELESGKKESDYKNLYGSESETIKAKETLLQSDFNVYCDTHNPPFWPTIPIRI